jgi:hypothetical protein
MTTTWRSIRGWGTGLVAAHALLAPACAPQALPARFPSGSVASPDADEARPARVTLALDEDPPLPGDEAQGWRGLDGGEDADPHRHHHGAH